MNRFAVVLALMLIALGSWVAFRNEGVLSQDLVLWTLPGQTAPTRLSVGHALLLSFGLGCATIALAWGVRVGRAIAAALSARQSARQGRQAEEQYQRGLEAMLDGQAEAALEHFKSVLARAQEHSGALMAGADLLRSLGQARQAAEWRERRLETAPENMAALHALAEDYRSAGNLAAAATTLERAIAVRPQSAPATLERLREVLLEAGSCEAALVVHDKLARLERKRDDRAAGQSADIVRAGIEVRWARAMATTGKYREAQTLLGKVVKRQPGHVPARIALFEVLAAGGDEDAAVDAIIDGYECTDDGTLLVAAEQHFLATRHEGDGIQRANAALGAFKRFAATSGRRPLARAFLGKLYTRFEMLDEAASAFEGVREEFTDNDTMTYYSARIAEKQGRSKVAAERYRSILKGLDVLKLSFRCRHCTAQVFELSDRCAACRSWGTLALEQEAGQGALPEPESRPVYTVPDDDGSVVEEDALA